MALDDDALGVLVPLNLVCRRGSSRWKWPISSGCLADSGYREQFGRYIGPVSALLAGSDELLAFDIEHVALAGDVRRGPLHDCWSTRYEHVAPVRKFVTKRGTPGFSGYRWSATTGDHVGYESWLERDHLTLLDFDPAIVGISSQPFWLHWHDGRRRRRHAPDYFARRVDGAGIVIDVRAEDRIDLRSAEAFEATAHACEQVGWEFRRVGALDPVLVSNLRWLGGYRHPRCLREGTAARLTEVFAQPRSLFAGVQEVGDPIAVLPTLFHLMWRQSLVADLRSAVLNSGTVVASAVTQ